MNHLGRGRGRPAPALQIFATERGAGAGPHVALRGREQTLFRLLRRGEPRGRMCRNIKTLFNFDPPATEDEVRAAALQFVRKLSGFTAPSKSNQAAFERAVTDTAKVAQRLLDSLVTTSEARNREVEAAKAKARSRERFGAKAERASF